MASRTVNKVVLLGHLGGDGDTRYTANGVARTTFSLATNRYWKDADGQAHEEADWHNVVLWRAENLTPYLIKGKQVYVDGRLKTRSWEDQDGNRRYTTEVIAEEVILLGGGSIGNGNETKPQPPEQVSPGDQPRKGDDMRGVLLWLIGIPIPIIILLYLFHVV